MAVDLVGTLPDSDKGNRYIMVVGDYFSRWMEAIPIPSKEANTVANRLVDEVFMHFSALSNFIQIKDDSLNHNY